MSAPKSLSFLEISNQFFNTIHANGALDFDNHSLDKVKLRESADSKTTPQDDMRIPPKANISLRSSKKSKEEHTIIMGEETQREYYLAGTLTDKENQSIFFQNGEQKIILGEGGSGKVRLAYYLENGKKQWIAVKKMKNFKEAQKEIEQFKLIQAKLGECHYIINLHDYAFTVNSKCEETAYLFIDWINSGFDPIVNKNGDLCGFIETPNLYPELNSTRALHDIAQQCLEAVNAFHKAGLAHSDIKSNNFALTQTGAVKLIDYIGISPKTETIKPVFFTPNYLPNSVRKAFKKEGKTTSDWSHEQLDRFALGILLLELRNTVKKRSTDQQNDYSLTIKGNNISIIFEKIKNEQTNEEDIFYQGISIDPKTIKGETMDEIIALLLYDKSNGLTLAQILKKPFFKEPSGCLLM